jgi:hypothetical protein
MFDMMLTNASELAMRKMDLKRCLPAYMRGRLENAVELKSPGFLA